MKNIDQIKRVVLAYSGGLDTSVMIPWLKENFGCEVYAVCADIGQGADELDGLKEKALKSGASKIFIKDLKEEFVSEFIFKALKSGAIYEGRYLLGTAIARPLIAKTLVEVSLSEKVDAIVHGCTGKGNDQVRFELGIKAFAPDMKVIAPWRFWELNSREKEIAYAKERGIPLKISLETNYSKDRNLFHLSHEGLDLEDPENAPKYDKILEMSVSPRKAPDFSTSISITFNEGIPVAINDKYESPVTILERLNEVGGKNGIGIIDMVENRLIGMKSRGVYETPGGTILYAAHELLEELCLDKDTKHYKQQVALKIAELIYNGKWYTPLFSSLMEFVNSTQKVVNGKVGVNLYKGNIIKTSVSSPNSLYSKEDATFELSDFNHEDATGFIRIYGLPITTQAKVNAKTLKD